MHVRRELWVQGWASVPVEAIRWSWWLTEEGRMREREKDRKKKEREAEQERNKGADSFLRFIPTFPSQSNNYYIN